jgi:hypothetical protein
MNKFFLLLILISSSGYSQTRLSDQAQISVITCGPWQGEVFTAFGHSAFRVYDPANGIDDAYNYGVFDFDQPHFYLNFARGHNYYMLGVHDYKRFESVYIYYNRYLHEQVLNLTSIQCQRLFDYLQWNARPENKFYRYDYFYDNCATKIPEVVLEVFGDSVNFDGSYIKTNHTIRELTDQYLEHQPWGDLGIDIGLGLPMDKIATPFEYMFLPDYVESGFDHATIARNNTAIPLVKEKIIIYESRPEIIERTIFHPYLVFGVLAFLAVVLTALDLRRKKNSNWFDIPLFAVTGIIGTLLLLLATATDHKAAAWNLNLLWALPTHIVVVFLIFGKKTWIKNYFLVTTSIGILTLLTWPFLPQKLNAFLIPLVIALTIRSFTQYYLRKLKGA